MSGDWADFEEWLEYSRPLQNLTPEPAVSEPIALPPPSCYDCEHCQGVAPEGHTCAAPVPAWAQGERNAEIPIIEDASHDATMAEHCSLFTRRK